MEWVLLALLLLIFLVTILKIQINVDYAKEDHTNHLDIRFSILFGLIHYKKSLELKAKLEEGAIGIKEKSGTTDGNKTEKKKLTIATLMEKLDDVRRMIALTVSLKVIVFKFLERVHIKDLQFASVIGDEDAVKTAIYVGGYWSVLGTVVPMVENIFSLDCAPRISVDPIFYKKTHLIHAKCIFDFRIGHLMWAGIKFIYNWNGKRKFLIIPVVKSEHKTA